MSAIAAAPPRRAPEGFYGSNIGKKATMAVTGVILFLFLIGHLAGNLQVFEGPEKMAQYTRFLHSMPAGLWFVRAVLIIAVVAHIWSATLLAKRKWDARPTGYKRWKPIGSTYASRTMYWSGPIILAFVIYHLLDFTIGPANPNFVEGDPYHNIVASFSNPVIASWYIFAMILLCLHLYHGLFSMFQSVGLSHPRYTPMLRRAAKIVAVALAAGFISIPVAVLTKAVS